LLADLVNVDSSFDDPAGVRAVLERLAGQAERLGAGLEWRSEGGFDHLRATVPAGSRRVALLGHADTVFPRGTASVRAFRLEGETARGPGVADMKGGLVVAIAALEHLAASGHPAPTVELVVVGDEETRLTPPPFMDVLGRCDACLVLEAAGPGGRVVVGRKGGAWARLVAEGKSAHSGTEPERGSSAILALCRELLRVAELDGSRAGVTLSVGKIAGGSLTNVVPDRAEAALDLRSPDPAALEATIAEALAFGRHAGVQMRLEVDGRWPGMTPEPRTERLADTYEALGRAEGVPVGREFRGGMSDGCWVAEAGVPTLDGLGPIGAFDHSPDEYVEVQSITDRAALLAGLLVAIETGETIRPEGENHAR
jgi:glutamate carboxypeptidase